MSSTTTATSSNPPAAVAQPPVSAASQAAITPPLQPATAPPAAAPVAVPPPTLVGNIIATGAALLGRTPQRPAEPSTAPFVGTSATGPAPPLLAAMARHQLGGGENIRWTDMPVALVAGRGPQAAARETTPAPVDAGRYLPAVVSLGHPELLQPTHDIPVRPIYMGHGRGGHGYGPPPGPPGFSPLYDFRPNYDHDDGPGPATALGAPQGMGPEYHHAYCDHCQQPVIADSRVLMEHQRQGHSVHHLMDAYRSRLGALQNAVNGGLLTKRDALLRRSAALQARGDETRAVKAALEREARGTAEDALERLRSAEALQLTLLQREADEVARELEAITRFVTEVVARTASPEPLEFLGRYRALSDAAARLIARPAPGSLSAGSVEGGTEELRRALQAEDPAVVSRTAALTQLVGVKDRMIWSLLAERDALRREVGDAGRAYGAELDALEAQCARYAALLSASGLLPDDPPPPPPAPAGPVPRVGTHIRA